MFRKKRYPFEVTVHLDGRHPYLQSHELDYPSRDVVMIVPAKDWNDAERQALSAGIAMRDCWRCSVKSIGRVRA